jgi:hypothetical protein
MEKRKPLGRCTAAPGGPSQFFLVAEDEAGTIVGFVVPRTHFPSFTGRFFIPNCGRFFMDAIRANDTAWSGEKWDKADVNRSPDG